jgi:hypothetical protein
MLKSVLVMDFVTVMYSKKFSRRGRRQEGYLG